MLLIITHHYSVHGGWGYSYGFSIHKFYIQSLSMGGKVGVNLFVLVSGYFLCDRQIKINAISRVLFQTWFYSVVIMLIFLSQQPLNIKEVITSLLPFGYWFVNSFLCLIAFSPLLNIIINNINKRKHAFLIFISTIIVITPILNGSIGNVGFFAYLYFVGAYLKRYCEHITISWKTLMMTMILSIAAILASMVFLDMASLHNKIFDHPLFFIKMNSPFIIILSVSVFVLFKQIKIKNRRFINSVSSLMFGVYLIHDNNLVRPFIWGRLFNVSQYENSSSLYSYSIIVITSIFISCTLLEFTRKYIFDLFKIDKKIDEIIHKAITRVQALSYSEKQTKE